MRAIVALVAGIATMPQLPFHIANLLASIVWGFSMLYGAGVAGELANKYLGFLN